MANNEKVSLLLQPNQATIDILIEEHKDGTWIETGIDSWAILTEDDLNKFIGTLVEIRDKKYSKEK